MVTFSFSGHVYPLVREVTLPRLDPVRYTDPGGREVTMFIEVEGGKIEVRCACDAVDDETYRWAVARVHEVVTAAVDLFAFARGWSLNALLERSICNGEHRALALGEKSVSDVGRTFNIEGDFEAAFQFAMDKFELRFALRDLVSSLGTLNYSGIAAGRAVEAIRNEIAEPEMSEKAAWDRMRDLLRIDRAYVQFVTDTARAPRHGRRAVKDSSLQVEVGRRAWTIVDRYFAFLNRGGVEPLPEGEFPLLIEPRQEAA